MPTTESRAPLSLRATHTFAASRERVFRAWTEPEAVKKWFIEPTEGHWTQEPELDARVGGHYRFTGESGGKPWSIHGTFREVQAPERLVFTWLWEDHPNPGDSGDTVVTVEFFARGAHTEVVLTHERFTSEAARDDHETGWAGCFDAIERFLA